MDSSNFWKLDKIDKIGIALIFIVFALYSTFSCFASESEVVSYDTITGVAISSGTNHFISYSGSTLGYVAIEPGYKYTLSKASGNAYRLAFSNELAAADVPYYELNTFGPDSPFVFTYSDYKYVYFNFQSGSGGITLTREPLEGMSGAVDNLSYYAGFNLWESFSNTIVYALPITITCFGIYVICGFIHKFSKGA